MAKNPYLMVSLEDTKSKALAMVLSNDTARAIMKYMTEHDNLTETELAEALRIPLSTAHYNIQNLIKAGLVRAAEFHYSEKGKEVMHYTLSNKIIIIAPEKERRNKLLRKLLPVIGIMGMLTAGLSTFKGKFLPIADKIAAPQLMRTAVESAALDVAPIVASVPNPPFYTNIVLWFLAGAAISIIVYFIIDFFANREKA